MASMNKKVKAPTKKSVRYALQQDMSAMNFQCSNCLYSFVLGNGNMCCAYLQASVKERGICDKIIIKTEEKR